MPSDTVDLVFPLGGVNKQLAFQSSLQKPYTCSDAMNVWPRDPIAGRMRGGSRPGLKLAMAGELGGPVHMLANVRTVEGTTADAIVSASDTFGSQLTPPRWTASTSPHDSIAINRSSTLMTPVDGRVRLAVEEDSTFGDLIFQDIEQDTSENYTVRLEVGPTIAFDTLLDVAPEGRYVIHLGLHNTNPEPWQNCVTIINDYPDGSTSRLTIAEYTNGVAGTLVTSSGARETRNNPPRVHINGNTVTAYMYENGPSVAFTTSGSLAGRRIAFGMYHNEVVGVYKYHTCEAFSVSYSGTTRRASRNIVVSIGGKSAAAGPKIDCKFEDTPGTLVAAGTTLEDDDSTEITNANGHELIAAQSLGKLYIAGEANESTAKEIWSFDPTGTGTLDDVGGVNSVNYASWPAPQNCQHLAVWRNRLCVVDRTDEQNIKFAKVGAPLDWQYGTIPVGTATQLNTTGIDAGELAEPVNALIAHSDDFLIIGCANSLYLLQGDPTMSGQINRLSSSIGIVSLQAWARGPDGETVFLSNDGIYALAAGPNSYPQSVSREKLPRELQDVDVVNNRILMEYDVRNRGVFIGITPINEGGGTYFWFDWEFRGFWPMSFSSAHEPMSLVFRDADSPDDRRLLFGCRDGKIRAFHDSYVDDDGTLFDTHILIGPIMLGGGGYYDGMLREVIGQLGISSGQVTCEVLVGKSAEDALGAKPVSPLRLTAGKNKTIRPCRRGNAAFIKLSSSDRWALENLTIVRERLGKQRL